MKVTRWVVLSALAGIAGCRDLGLPGGAPGEEVSGPEVSFLIPDTDGAELSLNPDIDLSAADVTGVAQVELRCAAPGGGAGGQVQLRVWTAPPYRGTVDLAPCRPLGVPQPDGTLLLALVVHATDRQGNPSAQDAVREVRIDPGVAALTTTAPSQLAPGTPLTFTLQSDRDLQGVPQVTLGESVAVVTGGPRTFTVTFSQLPGLGVDVYDAGSGPVPLEVLQDVEETVVLSIQARTLNGNVSNLNLGVTLSRLRWQRLIPNVIFNTSSPALVASRPVATGAGIQIPLDVGGVWLPGFFARADGRYTPFPAEALDGGFVFRGFDGQGNALANRQPFGPGGGVETMFFAPGRSTPVAAPSTSMLRTANDFPGPVQPMARLGNALCEVNPIITCGSSQQELDCVSPSGPSTRATAAAPGVDTDAAQSVFGSGNTVMAINLPLSVSCSSIVDLEWAIGTANNFTLGPDACEPPCPPTWNVERVLPVGDGSFVLSHENGQFFPALAPRPGAIRQPLPAGARAQAFLVEGDGGISKVYFSGVGGAHNYDADELMVARRDRAVAVFRSFPDRSDFELWAPQSDGSPDAGPIARSSIPSFLRLPVTDEITATNAVALADNKVAMLLNLGDPQNYGLLVFDANMRPRWLYRYPRSVLNPPVLVASSDTLYLVDAQGQTVLAFTP